MNTQSDQRQAEHADRLIESSRKFLEITSKLYFDKNDLWPMEPELKLYNRFKMEPRIVLKPNHILSAYSLVPKLKFIVNKVQWGAYFQGSIKKIPYNDYLVIKQEMIKTIEKWK